MEAYPAHYVEHNLPLLLVSGLASSGDGTEGTSTTLPKRHESGTRIITESPKCQSMQLNSALRAIDGSNEPCNTLALPGPAGIMRYKIKTVGRSYMLPARKAAPMPQSPGADGLTPRNTELHSPLSPLSFGSPIFPDGIMTPAWFAKHQGDVPAVFLAVFTFDTGEAAAKNDELLKSDINVIRNALNRSGFRTRLAVIMVGNQSILQAPEIEERLASIRRATSLDAKTGIFYMPPMPTQSECTIFVQNTMLALQASCVEYYRDLSKHARRKKARSGTAPQLLSPLVGAAQSTSTSGWNVRYEIKQGAFAEFRQEMDVAERHYAVAIEELLSPEGGVFETTVNWSPRWDEARLLCDSLAIRVLRCHLWVGSTTTAVQFWQTYRVRMKHTIDQRGKGSLTYGWEAWEARWASLMSELIRHSDLQSLRTPNKESSKEAGHEIPLTVFVASDRTSASSDRTLPFHMLHHPGYWWQLVTKGIRSRWTRASAIPAEDRIPPYQSPASAVVHRAKNYDTYLVLEPYEEIPRSGEIGYDYSGELKKAYTAATTEFDARAQHRMSEYLRLELGRDLVRAERYQDSINELAELWTSCHWRHENWQGPFADLTRLLLTSVQHEKSAQHAALVPALTWELLSIAGVSSPKSPNMSDCFSGWDLQQAVDVQLDARSRLSPISIASAFKVEEGFVGDLIQCQLTLRYSSPPESEPIVLGHLIVSFGESHQVIVRHKSTGTTTNHTVSYIAESSTSQTSNVEAFADLSFAPSQARSITLPVILREAQVLVVSQIELHLLSDKYHLTYTSSSESIKPNQHWFLQSDDQVESILLPHWDLQLLNVLPKPPKMEIHVHDFFEEYCTDELICLSVELINREADSIHASVACKVIGAGGETIQVGWDDIEKAEPLQSITAMPSGQSISLKLYIPAPKDASIFTLTIDARYTLESAVNEALVKSHSAELNFVAPFDASFTLGALLHESPWPSFFDPNNDSSAANPDGIIQLWKLTSQVLSTANRPVHIHEVAVLVEAVENAASCDVLSTAAALSRESLAPGETISPAFQLTTQKYSLDDRRNTYLTLSLAITWSRQTDSDQKAQTVIPIPRLSIPASEPRVLCTVADPVLPHTDLTLQYTLENPSSHFLTFALTMEANEDFAFSGAKYRTLSLAPLSRHLVEYHIVLHDQSEAGAEGSVILPNLQVVDSYYQKNLRIQPGTERVRLDDKRNLCVWTGPSR
ncbi:uncharacterized protein K489DRAFT_312516 [Dissoconium aciculare CBS 342.82]|uniref:Trafficking protein particle complex subunit 11 domain-containing protein n=1 Tax=Dissoconium aciculare CBS 342.82 TaxID=1314786 RepID=A0A6J3MI04_9PEZI|nr:uncharacterized protein K489DRAFT_312516 [Dissoconium aciculare CBS 342.82]KAF1826532.1 hypothetical protein K489DRAFT_312516 [Dissoconium aciculare CBS 342.82]